MNTPSRPVRRATRCVALLFVASYFTGLAVPVTSFGDEPPATGSAAPSAWVQENLQDLVTLYRHFHQHPELSLHEKETAARLAKELRSLGIEVTESVGGHGLVGFLRNGNGPTLMLRTDLDALPVTEATELAYASKVRATNKDGNEVGVMHACGHDMHMTSLIGVARYLATHRDRWQGTVMFLGQPAEELGAGAQAMLADGLFTRFPKPDFAVAIHVDAALKAGQVKIRPGYVCANVDSVDITMKGRGGHGAYPHTTIDPVLLAAHLVVDLQSIVSREIKPTDPAVITVGAIHGGTKHNVIADTCHLKLTVRSYSDEVRKHLIAAIRRKAAAVAAGAGAPAPEIRVSEGTPSLKNDAKLADRIGAAFRRALGNDQVVLAEPTMGGEDFSRYGRAGVPILMFGVGTIDAKRLAGYARFKQPPPSLHSPRFYPDAEQTLATAITATIAAALELMPTRPSSQEGKGDD